MLEYVGLVAAGTVPVEVGNVAGAIWKSTAFTPSLAYAAALKLHVEVLDTGDDDRAKFTGSGVVVVPHTWPTPLLDPMRSTPSEISVRLQLSFSVVVWPSPDKTGGVGRRTSWRQPGVVQRVAGGTGIQLTAVQSGAGVEVTQLLHHEEGGVRTGIAICVDVAVVEEGVPGGRISDTVGGICSAECREWRWPPGQSLRW